MATPPSAAPPNHARDDEPARGRERSVTKQNSPLVRPIAAHIPPSRAARRVTSPKPPRVTDAARAVPIVRRRALVHRPRDAARGATPCALSRHSFVASRSSLVPRARGAPERGGGARADRRDDPARGARARWTCFFVLWDFLCLHM